GYLEMSPGVIVEAWYAVEGDELVGPPARTTAGAPLSRHPIRVEGDALYMQFAPSFELHYRRASPAQACDPPYLGVWRNDVEGRGGAVGIRLELARDGLTRMRLAFPSRTSVGMYELPDQTFTLRPPSSVSSSAAA